MLTAPTLDKLSALNLMGMARAFQEQVERADYQALTFEERLGLLVDREAQDRDNRRLERNLKAAKLRSNACLEDLDFQRPRGLDRALMLSLGDAQWVATHHCILIVGATGVGKTFVACALAQAAIRRVGTLNTLISRLNSPACTYPCPTLRRRPCDRRRMARGRRGSLLLRRRALPSPSPCRFTPARPKTPFYAPYPSVQVDADGDLTCFHYARRRSTEVRE